MSDQAIDWNERRKNFKLTDELRAEYQKNGGGIYTLRWDDGINEVRRTSDDRVLTPSEFADYEAQRRRWFEDKLDRRQATIQSVARRNGLQPWSDKALDLARGEADVMDELYPFEWNKRHDG